MILQSILVQCAGAVGRTKILISRQYRKKFPIIQSRNINRIETILFAKLALEDKLKINKIRYILFGKIGDSKEKKKKDYIFF